MNRSFGPSSVVAAETRRAISRSTVPPAEGRASLVAVAVVIGS